MYINSETTPFLHIIVYRSAQHGTYHQNSGTPSSVAPGGRPRLPHSLLQALLDHIGLLGLLLHPYVHA